MADYLTQQDVDDWSADAVSFAQRAALHAVSPALARLEHQNEALSRQLEQERRRGLYQTLDRELPNWRQIDNSVEWRQWLLLPYEMSGRPRQQHLNEAIAAADASRVATFFRGFLQEQAGAASRASAPASSVPIGKRTYTRADIVKYSDAYRRGQISEADYQRLQADIVVAAKENRIVDPPTRGVGKTRF